METLELLQIIWYLLVGFLLIGYSILDGFDLGVGILFPFIAKDDNEKEIVLRSIGPFWDGNEVWLLTAGGALFAAFPYAYATVFSGFYLALMLVLFSLIFRAVSIEFWNNDEKRRDLWKWTFSIGSLLPALLFGVALGNIVVGIPLDTKMNYTGGFFTLLRPYPLVIGLLGLAMILLHGATYLKLKTTGSLKDKAKKIANIFWLIFILLFALSALAAYIYMPKVFSSKISWIGTIIVLGGWIFLRKDNDKLSFLMSCLCFIGLWIIIGTIHFPNLVLANNDPSLSLTLYNASSTLLTLKVMFIIAAIGMPLVIGYTAYVYAIFKGRL